MNTMSQSNLLTPLLLHTGQHYDENMARVFFDQLKIPRPDFELEVGSGTNPWQVGEICRRFEQVLNEVEPDVVLVVGDVNSTVACSLTAAYRRIPVVHVEAGLRSYNPSMPEENNRIITDHLSSLFNSKGFRSDNNYLTLDRELFRVI